MISPEGLFATGILATPGQHYHLPLRMAYAWPTHGRIMAVLYTRGYRVLLSLAGFATGIGSPLESFAWNYFTYSTLLAGLVGYFKFVDVVLGQSTVASMNLT